MKDKWLDYAVLTLKACYNGVSSAKTLADDIGAPPGYLSKVVARLRAAGLIDSNYMLTKPANDIMINDVIAASGATSPHGPISSKVAQIITQALNKSITNIW